MEGFILASEFFCLAKKRPRTAVSRWVNVVGAPKDTSKYADGMWLIGSDGTSTVSDFWIPCMFDELVLSVSCLGAFSSIPVFAGAFFLGNNRQFKVAWLGLEPPGCDDSFLQVFSFHPPKKRLD